MTEGKNTERSQLILYQKPLAIFNHVSFQVLVIPNLALFSCCTQPSCCRFKADLILIIFMARDSTECSSLQYAESC